ncbi:hypothetical protein C8F01DRAFT_98160 [Mycena amicta]|nr:hypothetical protein C8F01DRAFT_98160 [Mycena amicta]
MDKARLHDWLLEIHPHVSWVDRLVVAEVPPRTTGKRRREADEEEEAPSRKRSRREDEIADDEDEATDGNSEPVSPPTSPPPPSLQTPSIRRRPTNPWDSPAPHLRLRPVPSSLRAPATRVIDPTLGYTPPVLARDPHPRPNTSIESPSQSSSSSYTPQPSAQILTRVIDPSKESPSAKARRMATITLANGAGGPSRQYIDGEKLHRLSAQFREEEEQEQERMRRVQWKGFSYCNGGASVPRTPTPIPSGSFESSKRRRDDVDDVEPVEEDVDAAQPCKKVRFASLPPGTIGNFRPRNIRLSRIALS